MAAIGTAAFAGANIYGAAFAGGATVTAVSVARDYRKFRQGQEKKAGGFWGIIRDFFSFIGSRKKEYGTQLLKNTGLSALGAGVVDNLDVIRDGAAKAVDFVREHVKIPDFSFFPEARAGQIAMISPVSPVSLDEAQTVVEETSVQPVDFKAVLESLNTEGWKPQAIEDLKAAQAGRTWAIQNMAHYAANGLQGVKVDYDLARVLAEEGVSRNYALSIRFLEDLDKISPPPTFRAEAMVMTLEPGETASFVPETKPVLADLPEPEESGVITRAVADVEPIDFMPLPDVKELEPVIVCSESFNRETGVYAYHCPEIEDVWLENGNRVLFRSDLGQDTWSAYYSGTENLWAPNFIISAVEGRSLVEDETPDPRLAAKFSPSF